MLKFLTHKLRTHSINEDPNQEKVDDDHDSGTESDDEFQDGIGITNDLSSPMESPASPAPTDSAVPSDTDFGAPPAVFGFVCASSEELDDESKPTPTTALQTCKSRGSELLLSTYNDQHSSEEELEVINSPKIVASQGCRPATAPEKRKWSQVSSGNGTQSHCSQTHSSATQQGQQTLGPEASGIVATCSAPVSRAGREPAGSGSSDEEVQGLLGSNSTSVISQPVQFRTSPPVDAHKPGRSLSPPPKLFHASTRDPRPPPRPRSRPRHHSHFYHHHHHHHHHHHYVDTDMDSLSACSPRKRHRPPHRQPRPCLDFEKMQQLKTRAVTAWRHSGEHGNELSVFCW
ncbi:lateral signaling target protein 2 homolog [Chelonus insularis]|uniref:lateral signaling target protein 2 homolog n=1 Tax=Chelonus insularis TaxID=460826 RepID=UPI00158F0EC7|nr:lateral signaling target protein 2 homolog [Chelonus insularis]